MAFLYPAPCCLTPLISIVVQQTEDSNLAEPSFTTITRLKCKFRKKTKNGSLSNLDSINFYISRSSQAIPKMFYATSAMLKINTPSITVMRSSMLVHNLPILTSSMRGFVP